MLPGHSADFDTLYRHYKDRVFNTVLGYVQNTEDAEELTQDVFVEVHRGLQAFRGDASAGTWIYRIAVNKACDFLRRRNRKKRFGLLFRLNADGRQPAPLSDFHHPGILLEHKERAAILFAAIARLPENQQTAFILARLEDLGNKDIAAIMQLSVGAVESLLSRAKENLRKQLEADFDTGRRNPTKKTSNNHETGNEEPGT